MADSRDYHFDFLLMEYQKLKDEQMKRIGFRDNMIYLTLTAIGSVFSFALLNELYVNSLLILPFLVSILGWLYITNDEKISAIGEYIKDNLIPKIEKLNSPSAINIKENWESFHKSQNRRNERKIVQLFFDLLAFCGSSIVSILIYINSTDASLIGSLLLLIILESVIILLILIQICSYAAIK